MARFCVVDTFHYRFRIDIRFLLGLKTIKSIENCIFHDLYESYHRYDEK